MCDHEDREAAAQANEHAHRRREPRPLIADPLAHDLLWEYAQRRRAVDAEFAADLEEALRRQGYAPLASVAACPNCCGPVDSAGVSTAVPNLPAGAEPAKRIPITPMIAARAEIRREVVGALDESGEAALRLAPKITLAYHDVHDMPSESVVMVYVDGVEITTTALRDPCGGLEVKAPHAGTERVLVAVRLADGREVPVTEMVGATPNALEWGRGADAATHTWHAAISARLEQHGTPAATPDLPGILSALDRLAAVRSAPIAAEMTRTRATDHDVRMAALATPEYLASLDDERADHPPSERPSPITVLAGALRWAHGLAAGLLAYIDDAKRACGDGRVSGEPLAEAVTRMRAELEAARRERDLAYANRDEVIEEQRAGHTRELESERARFTAEEQAHLATQQQLEGLRRGQADARAVATGLAALFSASPDGTLREVLLRVQYRIEELQGMYAAVSRARDRARATIRRLEVARAPTTRSTAAPAAPFRKGDRVTWVSSAAGSTTRKRGKVIGVVPKRSAPRRVVPAFQHIGTRDHESYIVDVGGKLYWPLASKLRRDTAAAKPAGRRARKGGR